MTHQKTGRFLGIPYDWRRPTWERMRSRYWNADIDRVIVPKAYGWGYDLNLHALLRKVGLLQDR